MARLTLIGALLIVLGSGCLGYQSALGFRARQAVMRKDAAAFKALMEEAADTLPAGPLDNPEKTVLTHFLDLASDPLFFPLIEDWLAKGWIGDDMTCAVFRAHYKAEIDRNPAAAESSAQRAVDRARKAAPDAERGWEVEACLQGAPFLTTTATAALIPYLKMAADPTEPIRFRAGLLDGMTNAYLTGADRLYGNQPELSREEAQALALQQASNQAARARFVLDATRPHVEAPFLSAATARGVLEVENVLVPLGRTFIGHYADSTEPYDQDLAWGWVRAIKHKKKITRIMGLSLWNRSIEPKTDVFWYLCARRGADPKGSAQVLGPVIPIEAIGLRLVARSADPDGMRQARCPGYDRIIGPHPLEATARAALAEQVAQEEGNGVRVAVLLKKRIVDGASDEGGEEE